jgi:hypothetical protein
MTTATQILLSHDTNVKVKICDAPYKRNVLCTLSFDTSEIFKIQVFFLFYDVSTGEQLPMFRKVTLLPTSNSVSRILRIFQLNDQIISPRRYPYFDVVVGLVWSHDPKSYAGGSVCYW